MTAPEEAGGVSELPDANTKVVPRVFPDSVGAVPEPDPAAYVTV